MANPRMTLLDLLNKAERGADPDLLRDGLAEGRVGYCGQSFMTLSSPAEGEPRPSRLLVRR